MVAKGDCRAASLPSVVGSALYPRGRRVGASMNAQRAERRERIDDLVAAADMLRAASAEREIAQRKLDQAVAREHDAALRCAELRAQVGNCL